MKKLMFFLQIVSFSAGASDLKYFDSKIDFWGDQVMTNKGAGLTPPLVGRAEGKFPWTTYLDPKNKEFFKEGDYTPPEPFMEIARNPTDENIKSWFEFMKRKNELAARLQVRMQEFLAKNSGAIIPDGMVPAITASNGTIQKANIVVNPARFHIRMYFDSHCHHCRRMFAVLKRLKDRRFPVEALQVDEGEISVSERLVPIGKADPLEMKQLGIKGVPYLIVADRKHKALLPPVQGYHDFEEVMELLKAASAL